MSFQRTSYDHCTYSRHLNENVSILGYVLNKDRYDHVNKARHELGLLGGTAVSHISGNLVDLESDLRGQTRFLSYCTKHQPVPLEPGAYILNDKTEPIDTRLRHLPARQMISYRAVPLPPPMQG